LQCGYMHVETKELCTGHNQPSRTSLTWYTCRLQRTPTRPMWVAAHSRIRLRCIICSFSLHFTLPHSVPHQNNYSYNNNNYTTSTEHPARSLHAAPRLSSPNISHTTLPTLLVPLATSTPQLPHNL